MTRCPIDETTRAWVEERWDWLNERFPGDRLRTFDPVLPVPRDFPDRYQGTGEDARILFERIADYMEVDPEEIDLAFFDGSDPIAGHPALQPQQTRGACGFYVKQGGEQLIAVDVRDIDDPEGLIGTLVHELAHARLAGMVDGEKDHEPLTDLLSVHLGMGVVAANAVLRERHYTRGQYAGWSVSTRGYLDMPTFGYALALYALAREEAKPAWEKHLRPDVRAAFRDSLRAIVEEES